MKVPFTISQFLGVFEQYNLAIWPVQIMAYLAGFFALYLAIRKVRHSGRIISGLLSCLWIWNGAAYHLSYFTRINKGAYLFAMIFIFQGILFFYSGVIKANLSFSFKANRNSLTGTLIILYAMVIYPIIGHLLGHSYPHSPVYGVAPCPTTIFTFGILLWTDRRVPLYLFIVPLMWALVGTSASLLLGIREDLGLPAAGLISFLLILWQQRMEKKANLPFTAKANNLSRQIASKEKTLVV